MPTDVETVRCSVPEVAARACSVPELGAEISRWIRRVLPHDGYMIGGNDPLTGAGCFLSQENGYSPESFRRTLVADVHGDDGHCFAELTRRSLTVGVLGAGVPEGRWSRELKEIHASEGYGSEMRAVLTCDGVVWGSMVLLRERGRPPFSPDEVVCAQALVAPLGAAMKRFVRRVAPRPLRDAQPPGVVVVGGDDRIKAATPGGRQWLRACAPDFEFSDAELHVVTWNIAYIARRIEGPALCRVPTARGWIAVQAERLDGGGPGDVVISVLPATGAVLVPAVAAWYGITPRERAVLARVLEGLPGKQIARRLGLSPYTVDDHLRAVYRKTGASGREELLAMLAG